MASSDRPPRGAPPEHHDGPEPAHLHQRPDAAQGESSQPSPPGRGNSASERAAQHRAIADRGEPAPGAHLILVGLPGVGKSTVGRAVAQRLGRPFLDFDEELERREGRTVARIFAEAGEAHFRALERTLTEELAGARPMVLAPGGGWITNAGVVALLRPPARIIYLAASPPVALRRLGAGHATRPLLQREEPEAVLRDLLRERGPLYEAADHVISTDLLDLQAVIEKVVVLATSKVVG